MGPNFYILLGPALAVAASIALGRLVVRALRVELHREEELVLGFVVGAACLSALVAAMAAVHLDRRGAFVGLTAVVVALALWRTRETAAKRLPRLEWRWTALVAPVFATFGTLYLANAMGTKAADGARILFLFVFSFGRHASAAVMHLAFLVALAMTVLCYGRRYGMPGAGAFGAIVVFTSPVAGAAATSALDDAAVACAVFAIFYLLETRGSLALCGLLAAFALSLRHTLPPSLVFRAPRELALWGTEAGGLLGPVFLLAPLALLALRDPHGRRLVPVAAVLMLAGAADARWMIPALPFLALAMGIALARSRGALPVLAVAAALFSWPGVVGVYADPQAWRIKGLPATPVVVRDADMDK
ncbi:MAG TPA: hypothetical protein VN442_16400 [Bryobacteraceae bacterium]|nr:hypothetical protein [Bryobacteraceae bacterium]